MTTNYSWTNIDDGWDDTFSAIERQREKLSKAKPSVGSIIFYRTFSQEQAIHLGFNVKMDFMSSWGADLPARVIKYYPEDDTCDLLVGKSVSHVEDGVGRTLVKVKRKSAEFPKNAWYMPL